MPDPRLRDLMHAGSLPPLCYYFARFVARGSGSDPDGVLAQSAALTSLRNLEGDVCVDLARFAGRPLFEVAADAAIEAPQAPALDAWVSALSASPWVGGPGGPEPLILDGERLYLGKYWGFEQGVATACPAHDLGGWRWTRSTWRRAGPTLPLHPALGRDGGLAAGGGGHRHRAALRGSLRGARDRQDHHGGQGPGPAAGPGPGASHRHGGPHGQGRRPPGRGGAAGQGEARRAGGGPGTCIPEEASDHPPPARPAARPGPAPPRRQSPAAGLPGGGRGVHDRPAPHGAAAGRPCRRRPA